MARTGVERIGTNWRRLRSILRKTGPLPMSEGLMAVCRFLETRMKVGIITQRPGGVRLRPLRPATIAKKGGLARVLVDSGRLLISIQTRRLGKFKCFVGVPGGIPHTDPRRDTARVGHFHEFGTVLTQARPFIEPVVLKERERIEELWLQRFAEGIGLSAAEFGRAKRRGFGGL